MGNFNRDYSGVERKEAGEGYAGEVPKPGIYNAVLSSVGDHTTSDTSTVWTFDLTDEPYEGWRGWVYTNAEGAAWKEMQILEALGLLEPGSDKPSVKTHEQIMKKAGPCRVKVKNETYEEEKRGKITVILPPQDGAKKKGKKEKKSDDPF